MKKLFFLLTTIYISFSFSQQKNIFLGVYNGSVIYHLKEIIPYAKVKNLISYSYAVYMGHMYIFRNFESYSSAYTSAEKKAHDKFKSVSEEECKNFKFSVVDNFNVKVVELKDKGLLFIFSGNIICMD